MRARLSNKIFCRLDSRNSYWGNSQLEVLPIHNIERHRFSMTDVAASLLFNFNSQEN